MPRFPVDTGDLQAFSGWLQNEEGKSRSEIAAQQIAVDVAKFFKLSRPSGPLHWEDLVDKNKVQHFLTTGRNLGCGPEGRLTKLDNLGAALAFLRLHILGGKPHPDYPNLYEQSASMNETLKGYKATLRKQKSRKTVERLEALSEKQPSLVDVSAVVDCNGLWADFDITVEAIEAEKAVDDKQLGRATLAIAALLLYKSFARTGAVCNATVPEFKAVKQVRGEGPSGSDVYVFAVREHKTGTAFQSTSWSSGQRLTRTRHCHTC